MEKLFYLCIASIFTACLPFQLNAQTHSSDNLPVLGPQLAHIISQDQDTSLSLLIIVKDHDAKRQLQQKFPHLSWENAYLPSHAYLVQIETSNLLDFLNQGIDFADYHPHVPTAELAVSFFDPRVNYIDKLQSLWGQLYSGQDLVCSVKEFRFDSLDIDLVGRYQSSGLASKQTSQHANTMASLIAGAGFNYYTAKGVAPRANLSSSSFLRLLPDPDQNLMDKAISVQNHSYGIGIESYYGIEAAAYDRQVERLPYFLHVFSAGNLGQDAANEGRYAGLPSFANITGNFKQAKNVLVVGAVDSMQQAASLSAAGPSHDGRLKPELVAFGEGGSSESAALVSGAAIILQDIYQQQQNGSLPTAAWLKAILCNSADDVGRAGPDFKTGYGNLNAFQACKDALSMRYVEDSIQVGQELVFSLTLPPGTRNLKIMLAWTDPASEPLNTHALQHDLELSLTHLATNQSWLPWVLNTFPDPDSLSQLAKRGRDHLNPMEQISIEAPNDGDYQIKVNGLEVDSAWQNFALVWSWQEAEHFEWLSPAKNGYFRSGEPQRISWQSNLSTTQVDLAYRYCSAGSQWLPIAEQINPKDEHYLWTLPDTVALMQISLLSSQDSFVSDTFFCGRPSQVNLDVECEDNLLLSWEALSDIEKYELFAYDGAALRSKGVYNDNFAWLDKSSAPERYFAVAPIMENDVRGLRSPLLFLDFQSGSCFIQQFFARLAEEQVELDLKLGSTQGIERLLWERKKGNAFEVLSSENALLSTDLTFIDEQPIEGLNVYRASVLLSDGKIIHSDEQLILYVRQGRYLVAPNPVEWGFEIFVEGPIQEESIFELVDTQGRTVIHYPLNITLNQIPTDLLPRGIYFYRIKNQGQIIEKGKLLIQ